MKFLKSKSLITKIIIGLIAGLILGLIYIVLNNMYMDENSMLFGNIVIENILKLMSVISIFADLFINALKAIAPILVFFLIISALSKQKDTSSKGVLEVVKLYLLATFLAALVAVIMSFLFPSTLTLKGAVDQAGPSSVGEVLKTTLLSSVQNPLVAMATGNYLGVLFWSSLIGISLKRASSQIKDGIEQVTDALTNVIKIIIGFAPLGIMGVVFKSLSEVGLVALLEYSHVLAVLVGSMAIMVLVINPIIVAIYTKEKPYGLIFKCLEESGMPAFFTRSSAANIPINLDFCKKMNVKEELYSVSIPLGATINMTGAAITITTLTLAAAYTQNIVVTFPMALVLSILAAVSACGASGVPGGSVLLLTTSTALFGISPEVASQVIGVGVAISVVQDSCETALNSSSDALYTIIVDKKLKRLENKN